MSAIKPKKPPRKPNPSSTDNLDIKFSRLIRARDLWTCRACGKEDPEGSVKKGSSLQCSHLVGRATFATRWHPLAAVCHCARCHMHLEHHPLEFAAWIKMNLSTTDVELLDELARLRVRWTERLKKDLLLDLRRELHRAEAAEAGRGEFFGFELPTVGLVIENARELAPVKPHVYAGSPIRDSDCETEND